MKHHHNSFMGSRTQILGQKTPLKHVKTPALLLSLFQIYYVGPQVLNGAGHQVIRSCFWLVEMAITNRNGCILPSGNLT